MDRAERRYRTEKIAKKRFRRLYCNYHGTPEAWLYYRRTQKDIDTLYGMCRSGVQSWSCRCDYCMGSVLRAQSIADHNFREGLIEADEMCNRLCMPLPNVQDSSSVGPYDWRHEMWDLHVCPWPRSWSLGDRFHHPKVKRWRVCQG
jgi:hypothetical protein